MPYRITGTGRNRLYVELSGKTPEAHCRTSPSRELLPLLQRGSYLHQNYTTATATRKAPRPGILHCCQLQITTHLL